MTFQICLLCNPNIVMKVVQKIGMGQFFSINFLKILLLFERRLFFHLELDRYKIYILCVF